MRLAASAFAFFLIIALSPLPPAVAEPYEDNPSAAANDPDHAAGRAAMDKKDFAEAVKRFQQAALRGICLLPCEELADLEKAKRETWQIEVIAEPESDAQIGQPLSKALGTAIDFETLVKLGETHGVQYLKGISCNNIGEPLGMGLWEGVPLRVLVWMTRPVSHISRVYYYGHHNDDPGQMFRSSLPIGRVLEDAPGELPVLLCYKLNGEYLTGKRGDRYA